MELRLIHADEQLNELQEISEFDSFAASLSVLPDGKCDWEMKMPAGAWSRCPVEAGHYIYIEDSEWGGPVEQVRHVSSDCQVRLKGTCWRGLLERRVVAPLPGETHYVLQEQEANIAVTRLLGGWQPQLFAVSAENSGIICSASLRYVSLKKALDEMLLSAGARLNVRFAGGRVELSALPSRDRSDEVELSQEYDAQLLTDNGIRIYNHILALGRGEMLERQVVELWLLPDGTITTDAALSQQLQSVNTLLYDYPAVESAEELENAARRKLLSYAGQRSMEIELNDSVDLELTDRASVRDTLTGMTAVLRVVTRELTINSSGVTLTHCLEE